ncbi:MAG: metal-sulfur cluster assembly factor [Candidatus Altiarchaeota archaeon]|nr:metal-sulfur cluster assembly factor [Candidatus Altiarchaeota archaeon]
MSNQLREALKQIKDPEVDISIVDLGLIYDISIKEKKAEILMTLTTPMCPVGGFILSEVQRVAEEQGYETHIELTFDPPWSPEKISKDFRRKLGI